MNNDEPNRNNQWQEEQLNELGKSSNYRYARTGIIYNIVFDVSSQERAVRSEKKPFGKSIR